MGGVNPPPTHPLQTAPGAEFKGLGVLSEFGLCFQLGKIARKSQRVMVKGPGWVKVFSPPLCSFKVSSRRGAVIQLWSTVLSVLWMGNSLGRDCLFLQQVWGLFRNSQRAQVLSPSLSS